MIRIEKFLVDAPLRRVICIDCKKKCWEVIESHHSAFRCVTPDCANRVILYLAPNFFEKVIENLKSDPSELDLSKPIRTRLTKKFFLSLPEDVFIMSNIFNHPGQPTYFKPISQAAEREKQWKEIVSFKCDRRICTVFKNGEEANTYLSDLYKRTPPPPETPVEPESTASDREYGSLAEELWEKLEKSDATPLPWTNPEDQEPVEEKE